TMGAGLPSAIAAKLVYPRRKVLAVCGDGGFLMNSQELETAVRLGLDLTVLIVRDDAYGMIRWKQAEMGMADFGMTLGNPDFVRLAEAYGAHGHRPATAADLAPTLARCLATPGVHVIGVADALASFADGRVGVSGRVVSPADRRIPRARGAVGFARDRVSCAGRFT